MCIRGYFQYLVEVLVATTGTQYYNFCIARHPVDGTLEPVAMSPMHYNRRLHTLCFKICRKVHLGRIIQVCVIIQRSVGIHKYFSL